MEKSDNKIMQYFIDKLCDHLPSQRIKVLIDNGFDEWETITYMKGQQLIDLGFDTQECIIIMVAVNSNALQYNHSQIFTQQKIQEIMIKAKQKQQIKKQQILKQQQENKTKAPKQVAIVSKKSINSIQSQHIIKQHPQKQLTENLISKGIFIKIKSGDKINFNKITVIALEQKQITHIAHLDKCTHLTNLNLGNNFIYRIQGLNLVNKIKDLKLHHNNISKIQGLDNLVNLQHLDLSNNYISKLQNLTNNTKLRTIYISKQKINSNFTFDEQSIKVLAYSLQKLECNQNKIKNITQLKYLKTVKEVLLAKNQLSDVGQLTQTITGMENLAIINFKQNPLTKSQKYRDYIVILSKTLVELDGKKILPEQREYLVKLYALKHARQQQNSKPKNNKKQASMGLKGVKMTSQHRQHNTDLNKATDLRGNMPFLNTKCIQFCK